MKESEVISHLALYMLRKNNTTITSISLNKTSEFDNLIAFLRGNLRRSDHQRISDIQYRKNGPDIEVVVYWGKRRGRVIRIEAKSDSSLYNLYTTLGQFICLRDTLSSYNWYGMAFPYSLKSGIKERLTNESGEARPIIKTIFDSYGNIQRRSHFYFVKPNYEIEQLTWQRLIK